MHVVLISLYELGRQPFGLASPTAWLENAGITVTCLDWSVPALRPVNDQYLQQADCVAFYVPMHTATRLAIDFVKRVRVKYPDLPICFYGLYAPLNQPYLEELGVEAVIGGEFEEPLLAWVAAQGTKEVGIHPDSVFLQRQAFQVPARHSLPSLEHYARLLLPNQQEKVVGYTEATRGCKHVCRHCPIVPVYQGRFFVVAKEVVLADCRQQIEAGAQHITFGDPDFFNGPRHAIAIVEALHEEFPHVTYDVTIKVEHLLKHASLLPTLRKTGCLLVTSAVEALNDPILDIFGKGHTVADFKRAVAVCQDAGITLQPTFVTFTPWTTLSHYLELLATLAELHLIENVPPIQYAIRLLIPNQSPLLERPETQAIVGAFDAEVLSYTWQHPDPRMDQLQKRVLNVVKEGAKRRMTRPAIFQEVWQTALAVDDRLAEVYTEIAGMHHPTVNQPIPQLSEPWY